ncbi:MAG TPA: glycosyltransferase family 2 protein [Candidatus Saccharimonadales bacterium]|nr:glycosyltransferase family 2 protein [Candidatus Saccharimonadales bacterium]
MSISVVISTFNRAKILEGCLESVKDVADEIIVVDNTSSDNTVVVAKKYTPHVYTRKNNPMLNVNKNFGFTKATKEWILYLDDDERVTDALRKEILQTIKSGAEMDGYDIPRKNSIFGKWIEHTGWYPDYQLRLFKNGKAKFPEVHVHEMVKVDGQVGKLTSPMVHQNYATIEEFVKKTALIYAPNEAEVLLKNGYVFSPYDAIRMPAKEFLSRYFAREGYKDGLHGFMLSCLMAFYHLLVFGYLWEQNHFKDISSEKFIPGLEDEAKKIKKELSFWTYTTKIAHEKNPIKKNILKILRKVS